MQSVLPEWEPEVSWPLQRRAIRHSIWGPAGSAPPGETSSSWALPSALQTSSPHAQEWPGRKKMEKSMHQLCYLLADALYIAESLMAKNLRSSRLPALTQHTRSSLLVITGHGPKLNSGVNSANILY